MSAKSDANRKKKREQLKKEARKTEIARRQEQSAANKKKGPTSIKELLAGLIADYAHLEGAVAQLEIFASRRAKYVEEIKQKEPTKYSELRAEAYSDYLEKIKPLREAMKDLAEFIGKAEDAPNNFERMQYVSDNLNKLYHATIIFEERSRELQDIDRRFQQEFIKKHSAAIIDTPDGGTVVPMNEAEKAEALADEPIPTVEDVPEEVQEAPATEDVQEVPVEVITTTEEQTN